ncbi:hypothetical protein JT55_00515 [Rhodovulum sp. NI22]|nr:hypothetical protein JT55_00515 [Rhodovulum sp. NI22]
MTFGNIFRVLLIVCGLTLVSACDSAEERAENHYQKGIALLQEGDVDRALLEFRNVFKLDPAHRDARHIYAKTVLERGNYQEAFSQYLRLVEQHPDFFEGRRELAELAVKTQNWEEARRHTRLALEMAPDDPRIQALDTAIAFRRAIQDGDQATQAAMLDRALALKPLLPENEIVRSVIIDGFLRNGDEDKALAEIDETIALYPENIQLYRMRLQLLSRQGREEDVEARLREMVRLFPDDEASKALLIRYYLSREDSDAAEAFLREQISPGVQNDDARITLIQFLISARGPQAAQAELDKFIEEGTNTDRFRAMRAGLAFDMGQQAEAIAELEDVVANAEPSVQTREIKVAFARILASSGNEVGARALVEEVLAEDVGMVEALKMRAAWLIEADQADEAINVLRSALDQKPDDPGIMTLMSAAHARNGDRELSGELLSLAVQASNSAPAESLRYAKFLIASDKLLPAEGVLIDALRLAPGSYPVLVELGQLYIRLKDWPRAEQVERALRGLDSDAGTAQADRLRFSILRGQTNNADAIAFLETLTREDDSAIAAQVAIVRAHLLNGKPDAARTYLDELLAESPDELAFRFLDAAVYASTGDFKAAEQRYRSLLKDYSTSERLWLELVRTLSRDGRPDAAATELDRALEILPEGRDLLWAKATLLEQGGDTQGAIAIYEKLYAQNTSTSVIANNLASLLSTVRDDADSLERAYAVARRLRGSDFPPYQDTYGWIAYRRGDYREALTHLEPAAAGLPQDPLVHYHLAKTYIALNRPDDAQAQLEKTLQLAGETARPEFDDARQLLLQLKNDG